MFQVSAASGQTVSELLKEQEVVLVENVGMEKLAEDERRGPVIRKSPGTREVVASSRAPPGKVVRPMRAVVNKVKTETQLDNRKLCTSE